MAKTIKKVKLKIFMLLLLWLNKFEQRSRLSFGSITPGTPVSI
jgi:hypothetical protein